jgi:hypothetical protein
MEIKIEKVVEEIKHNTNDHANTSICFITKTAFIECLNETSLHGIPKIMRNNYKTGLRIFWIFAFLLTNAYGIYLLFSLFQAYSDYPIYMTTKSYEETPTKFPAITFCNMKIIDQNNIFTQAYLKANNGYVDFPFNMFTSLLYWQNAQKYIWLTFLNGDTTLNETSRKNLGFQIENMLTGVRYYKS